ncbi:cyclic peptide export ABC transporter [Aquimarina pacifica]|uniref:cyclic peptide export ABC transporter n=1 Tax=Aquimarina pacifica TaxID=1296415 RepID=UPI00046F7392|nr:cyclic peptide export ABC transporter [Aquimarina pacifica]
MLKLKFKSIVYIVLYAIPNTVLSFGIIYIINNVLSGNPEFSKDYIGIVFLAIVVYTYLLNIIFQKKLNHFSFELLYENEKKIFNQILKAPLILLEKFGKYRFYTAVEDLRTFASLPQTVTHTVNSILMLILGIVYLFLLSVPSAFIVLSLIIIVAVCYLIIMHSMSKQVAELKVYNEQYFKYVDDVMNGFKELKLNFFRRSSLMNKYLSVNRDQSKQLDFKINYVFLSINLISQYGLYMVVAVILFLLPVLGLLETKDVISYVVIILFISGPINNLINLQPIYTQLIVANKRIKNFVKDFHISFEEGVTSERPVARFDSLQYRDMSFSYTGDKEDGFALGPINLEIKEGETIFIVGGNGSGKSTFINVLTGLYEATEGQTILNGTNLKYEQRHNLQSLIAAVFTNNHIFSKNYDNYTLENNKDYIELLKLMSMDKVVEDDKEESARRHYSKGQSKRMSLIFTLLENKPILVLDEWAADQDPHFRKFFYEKLIPKLKAEGKTIIAVTHDDAYFHQADRIIKFDHGQIIKDVQVQKEEKLTESFWA